MTFDPRLHHAIAQQPYPLLFVTISGAHLYGFPSPDSDFDLRGVHVLPPGEAMGLYEPKETIEISRDEGGLDLDLVTHELRKFMLLMLKKNGYVLEQLHSPLVLHTSPEHAELRQIARGCVTRYHGYHYLGFAETQWQLFAKERPRRVKPLLYVYRVLLTGIHLVRTGEVEANLQRLNEGYRLPYVPDLVQRKLAGKEKSTLADADMPLHKSEYQRLRRVLEEEMSRSSLPETPSAKAALNDLLLRVRKWP